jgi:membrane associated rhomboid family serine protease
VARPLHRARGDPTEEADVIPLSDDPPRRVFPLVTIILIVINVLVFLYELGLGDRGDAFVQAFGAVPAEIVSGRDLPPPAPLGSPYLTLFTSMFLHGGFLHIASNMIYLWVFGDNVEDSFGHVGYLLFYLVCGLLAALAQVAIDPSSTIPSVGASGAIAGVLGAYLVIFGSAQVRTLVFIGPIILLPRIPAMLLIGFWFATQLISGIGSLTERTHETGGVAFWAHIGGFVAGLMLALLFRPRAAGLPAPRGY